MLLDICKLLVAVVLFIALLKTVYDLIQNNFRLEINNRRVTFSSVIEDLFGTEFLNTLRVMHDDYTTSPASARRRFVMPAHLRGNGNGNGNGPGTQTSMRQQASTPFRDSTSLGTRDRKSDTVKVASIIETIHPYQPSTASRLKSFLFGKKSKPLKHETNETVVNSVETENNDVILCIVCKTNKINILLNPCHHSELCETCAGAIDICCTCRAPIRDRVVIFTPFN